MYLGKRSMFFLNKELEELSNLEKCGKNKYNRILSSKTFEGRLNLDIYRVDVMSGCYVYM